METLVITTENKKELLKKSKEAKKEGKTVFFRPSSEELLRFALEKTPVDVIIGAELINPKDSVHFVRGGLDQITCKIAASRGKVMGFSFDDLLNAKNRPQLMGRISLNLKLCKKYKVKTNFFGNIPKQDSASFRRILEKQQNIYK